MMSSPTYTVRMDSKAAQLHPLALSFILHMDDAFLSILWTVFCSGMYENADQHHSLQ